MTCADSLSQGHAPPPPPGLAGASQPGLAPPRSSSQSYPATSPMMNGVSPNLAAGASSPQPPPPGYANHAESSRAGQAAAAGSFASPGQRQGVLGNLMQSFDMAKDMCKLCSDEQGHGWGVYLTVISGGPSRRPWTAAQCAGHELCDCAHTARRRAVSRDPWSSTTSC